MTATSNGRQTATQAETITPGPAASLTLAPANASVTFGSTQTFAASAADAYGNTTSPTITWSATNGTLSTTSGATTTLTPTATGTATVTATADTGAAASASVAVTAKVARVRSITYSKRGASIYVTVRAVPNAKVGLRILRSGTRYASRMVTTGAAGRARVHLSASKGCYSTTVTRLTAIGNQWDGVTPSNSYCFGRRR